MAVQEDRRRLICKGQNRGGVLRVAFSPDGQRLASCGYDKTLRIWDVATSRELLTLTGLTEYLNGLTFHPTRPQRWTADATGAVRCWDGGGVR